MRDDDRQSTGSRTPGATGGPLRWSPCHRCTAFELDLAAERKRSAALLEELGARAPGTCQRCAPVAAELAEALRDAAELREECAELLAALASWNRAVATALDGRGVQP